MKIRWSRAIAVSRLIGPGGKCGESLPEKTGIYRFRVPTTHLVHAGEVIYIGKVGGGRGGDRHLRRRIGEFIGAALGFEIPHSGGISFWDKGNSHKLWAQDLEVQVFATSDPACAELAAFREFKESTGEPLPRLNKVLPRRRCEKHGG